MGEHKDRRQQGMRYGLSALAATLWLGLAGSADAGTFVAICPLGTTGSSCATYDASGWRVICYCGTEVVSAVPNPTTVAELRRRFPIVHTVPLERRQGGPATLLFFSDEAAINRALDGGYRVETFEVSGRTATLRINFNR